MATATAAPELEELINKSQEAVQQQGDVVRSLKANLKDGKAQQVHHISCSFGCFGCCRLVDQAHLSECCPQSARSQTLMPQSRSFRSSSWTFLSIRRCAGPVQRSLYSHFPDAQGPQLILATLQASWSSSQTPHNFVQPSLSSQLCYIMLIWLQAFEKATGKSSSQNKEAFRAALVRVHANTHLSWHSWQAMKQFKQLWD
jgi:hypothetical protein